MIAPTILPSRIHDVTVHSDGAVVRRRIELAGVAAGLVRITGLPLVIAGTPVRARVRDGTAEVLSCRLAAVPTPPEAGDDRALERAVEEASAASEAAQRAVEAALTRLRALNALEPPARPDGAKGQPPPASPAAARFELLRFRDQQAERLSADLANARRDAELAAEAEAKAQAAYDEATSARQARAGELRLAADLHLRLGEGAPGWVELEYTVRGARWAPSYILRFDAGLSRVAVQLRAVVAQRSGEDWSGVRIACATAALQSWCELPRLPARRIGRAQPSPPSAWRPAPAGADALFSDWDAFAAVTRPAPSMANIRAGARARPIVDEHESVKEEVPQRRAREEAVPCAAPPPAPAVLRASRSAPSPEPMREKMKKSRRVAPGGGGEEKNLRDAASEGLAAAAYDEVESDAAAPGPPPELQPTANLLDFAALRLADREDTARGRPRPSHAFIEDGAWRNAIASARRISGTLLPPPPGHAPVAAARQAVRWEGQLPVDVPADGGWHVVPLAAGAAESRLTLVVVPRESRTAFRSVTFANPFDRALTGGPADVYVGADFLLTAHLGDIATGATSDLGLGVEQSLAVARNATYAEESAGMLGGSLRLRHHVAVSLHNKSQRPAAIEVRERLPQPDEQVEHCVVKELQAVPPWQSWQPPDAALPGGRRWTLTLEAGAKAELAYEYRIEIPAKNEVVGGNRREA